jgi:hypothetical protein
LDAIDFNSAVSSSRGEWRIPISYHTNPEDRLPIIAVSMSVYRDENPPSDPDHSDLNDHDEVSNFMGDLMTLAQFPSRSPHSSRRPFVPFTFSRTLELSLEPVLRRDGLFVSRMIESL